MYFAATTTSCHIRRRLGMSSYLPWVRCPTCGKVISKIITRYHNDLRAGVDDQQAINNTGIPQEKFCCRSRVLSAVPPWCEPLLLQPETDGEYYSYLDPVQGVRHVQAK